MSMWITRIILKTDEATKKKLLEWLVFCKNRDETFQYKIKDNLLIIKSKSRNQAFKRGSAIYKRFGLHYNVEKE